MVAVAKKKVQTEVKTEKTKKSKPKVISNAVSIVRCLDFTIQFLTIAHFFEFLFSWIQNSRNKLQRKPRINVD